MEFKGTKGKFKVGWGKGLTGPTTPSVQPFCDADRDYMPISINKQTIAIVPLPESNLQLEMKANALLISKAPEMLEMLKTIIKERELGIVTGIDSLRINRLIKEATEI